MTLRNNGRPLETADRWRCPLCGWRARSEFEPVAAPRAAPKLEASSQEWFSALYLQEEPRADRCAPTTWRHAHGCGAILVSDSAHAATLDFVSPAFAAAMRPQPTPAPAEQAPARRRRRAAPKNRRIAS